MEHEEGQMEEVQFVGENEEDIERPPPRRAPSEATLASSSSGLRRAGGATSPAPQKSQRTSGGGVNPTPSGSRRASKEVQVTIEQENDDDDIDEDLNFTAMESAKPGGTRGRVARAGRTCGGNYYLGMPPFHHHIYRIS